MEAEISKAYVDCNFEVNQENTKCCQQKQRIASEHVHAFSHCAVTVAFGWVARSFLRSEDTVSRIRGSLQASGGGGTSADSRFHFWQHRPVRPPSQLS